MPPFFFSVPIELIIHLMSISQRRCYKNWDDPQMRLILRLKQCNNRFKQMVAFPSNMLVIADYAHIGSEAILRCVEEKQPRYVYPAMCIQRWER